MVDPGEGPEARALAIFLDQTEAQRAKKKFETTPPPLSQGLDDQASPRPPISEGLDPPLKKKYTFCAKVTVKRATKKCNLFRNIAAKRDIK